MLVSLSHSFIFVHVPKTAGSSITKILTPYSLPRNNSTINKLISRWAPKWHYHQHHFRYHDGIQEAYRALPIDFVEQAYKFAFVRNPYDWLVSLYEYIRQQHKHRYHKKILAMDFATYIDFEISRNRRSQNRLLCNHQGQLQVNFIGRIENIEMDFNKTCQQINIEPVTLPYINGSVHRDYREYYTSQLKQKVAQHWARDLNIFGYNFSGIQNEHIDLGRDI